MARIVFDLDGTLIDSAPDIQAVANHVLAMEGQAPITLAETKHCIGNGAGAFVAKMRAARDIADSEQDRMLAAFVARYNIAVDRTVPYAGVLGALAALAARGHRLGICTNKPEEATHAILGHLDMAGSFETVFGGDTLPLKKPDPAPLRAAFAALGEGPAIYVGDSEVDAETARRAGVPFLLHTEGYRKTPVEDFTSVAAFGDWRDVPALIERHLRTPGNAAEDGSVAAVEVHRRSL